MMGGRAGACKAAQAAWIHEHSIIRWSTPWVVLGKHRSSRVAPRPLETRCHGCNNNAHCVPAYCTSRIESCPGRTSRRTVRAPERFRQNYCTVKGAVQTHTAPSPAQPGCSRHSHEGQPPARAAAIDDGSSGRIRTQAVPAVRAERQARQDQQQGAGAGGAIRPQAATPARPALAAVRPAHCLHGDAGEAEERSSRTTERPDHSHRAASAAAARAATTVLPGLPPSSCAFVTARRPSCRWCPR
jgi:hypothetical protein